MRSRLTIIAAAALLLGAPAHAQFTGQSGDIAFGADTTEFAQAGNVVRLIGRANVWQGDARLMADRLEIYFAEGGDSSRSVDRIEATGSVAYITPVERALGDEGTFEATTETVVLTGDVVLIQGDTVLTGNRLVVQSQTGDASLTSTPGSRIRGVFSSEGESAPALGAAGSGGSGGAANGDGR